MSDRIRIERDAVGELRIDPEAYYGVQSKRAEHNFPITGRRLRKEMIFSLAQVKKAAAITNRDAGILPEEKAAAILEACDDILHGKFHDQFICDPIQGGAGTSANMNANEVIANRAQEILGGEKGVYDLVHPNDHVNMSQSTNDVFPTAGKLTVIVLLRDMMKKLYDLEASLRAKANELTQVVRIGQTQLQDAVPMRMSQVFNAFAAAIFRDLQHLDQMEDYMYINNMGGTAIGSGINANKYYMDHINENLCFVTGFPMTTAKDLFDGTQNLDSFVIISGALKSCAVSMSKMCNDLRLLSSGPRAGFNEITLPARQNGSSIMPGKINPVIPEVVTQVAYQIIGNDVTIALCAEAGQLQLNAFEPVLFNDLFDSIISLGQAAYTLRVNCIEGITVNEAALAHKVEQSLSIVTALCPIIGYSKASDIAKTALKTGESIRQVALRETDLSEEQLNEILNVEKMTHLPNEESLKD